MSYSFVELLRLSKELCKAERRYNLHHLQHHCAVCGKLLDEKDVANLHSGMFNRTCIQHDELAGCYDLELEMTRRNMGAPYQPDAFWDE